MSSEACVRITLVRHGESVANRTKRWQGQGDSPLSELGRAQARALASRLAARSFDRIVASDLDRASSTACALERAFERDPSFREFDVGAWEGLTREEVAQRFADELARLEAGEDVALGGGESYQRFCARIDAAMARLRAELAPGQHALVVCHGGVIGALVAGALGLRGLRVLPLARILNTAITELSYDGDGQATLSVFNDSLHLAALALFPHPLEMSSALALVCDRTPHAAFGAFAAHYDAERDVAALRALGKRELTLEDVLAGMRTRHPECRVALSATAQRIHAWSMRAVWGDGPRVGALLEPLPGSLCHVSWREGRLALIDYGISR